MDEKLLNFLQALLPHPSTQTHTRIRLEPQQYSIQAQHVTYSMTPIDLSYYGHQNLETLYGLGTHRYGLRDTAASIFTSGVSKEIKL